MPASSVIKPYGQKLPPKVFKGKPPTPVPAELMGALKSGVLQTISIKDLEKFSSNAPEKKWGSPVAYLRYQARKLGLKVQLRTIAEKNTQKVVFRGFK